MGTRYLGTGWAGSSDQLSGQLRHVVGLWFLLLDRQTDSQLDADGVMCVSKKFASGRIYHDSCPFKDGGTAALSKGNLDLILNRPKAVFSSKLTSFGRG